ncbi:hypothetical protein [Domibacillus mangrovi]|uniref:Uncharacterized protein n=1 Tax=Domibacillus mangrovi TaxID=1714354 RepID=A0A1Q5P294_9BACI|nr:hypothetical protein [Domibacillus mangrovi]OKL36369.1 hypothetical protein BLL40_10765 [Domibacillus mangrovi]
MSPYYNRPLRGPYPYYGRPPYYNRPPYYGGYGVFQSPFIGGLFGGLAGSLLTPIIYGRPPYYGYY